MILHLPLTSFPSLAHPYPFMEMLFLYNSFVRSAIAIWRERCVQDLASRKKRRPHKTRCKHVHPFPALTIISCPLGRSIDGCFRPPFTAWQKVFLEEIRAHNSIRDSRLIGDVQIIAYSLNAPWESSGWLTIASVTTIHSRACRSID